MSSPVIEHVSKEQHRIDWDSVKVLDQEADWFTRGVREAIQICRQGSTLNRDRGRHYLRPVYHSLLSRDEQHQSRDESTEA